MNKVIWNLASVDVVKFHCILCKFLMCPALIVYFGQGVIELNTRYDEVQSGLNNKTAT